MSPLPKQSENAPLAQAAHDMESAEPLLDPTVSQIPSPEPAAGITTSQPNYLKSGQLGKYHLLRLLGKGASGEVWMAFDPDLRRHVAIKKLRYDKDYGSAAISLIRDEARKLAQIKHPGIVTVYEFGQDQETYFLVSELIGGGTLLDRMRRGDMALPEAVGLAAEIAWALHHAHLRGIVHRDVKPSNVLLDDDGHAHLSDFGLAATEDEQLDEQRGTLGTWGYMSPEQVCGRSHQAEPRSDIYSLGAVLYEMLTGRLPFRARTSEEWREQIMQRAPRPLRTLNDRVPPELERLCLSCLAKEIDERPTSALDVAEALEQMSIQQSHGSLAHRHGRKWLAWVLALAAVVALAAWLARDRARDTVNPARLTDNRTATGAAQATALSPLKQDLRLEEISLSAPDFTTWEVLESGTVVRMFSEDLALLQVGKHIQGTTKWSVQIDQRPWRGLVGVFFGLRRGEARQPSLSFHLVRLETVMGRRMRLLGQFDTLHGNHPLSPESRPWGFQTVDPPPRGPQLLTLELRDGQLAGVTWGGREYAALVDGWTAANLPEQAEGGFGLYCFDAGARFSAMSLNDVPLKFVTD